MEKIEVELDEMDLAFLQALAMRKKLSASEAASQMLHGMIEDAVDRWVDGVEGNEATPH